MEKINVLLVANQRNLMGFDRMAKIPNLGLSSIAGNMNKEVCEVKIIDLIIADDPDKILVDTVKKFKPKVVGFSSMIFQEAVVFKYAKAVKEYDKSIITVLGGYHPTVTFDEFFDRKGAEFFDFIIRGEGEFSFNSLVESIYFNKDTSQTDGISYKSGDTVIHNPVKGLTDLSKLKLPDRKARLLNDGFHILGLPADVVETSRGCTFDCNFCCITLMYSRSFRKFTIERIISDIKDAKENGAKVIFFVDDNITIDPKRFASICKAIINEKLNMKFVLQASVKGLSDNDPLLDLMEEAGFMIVFLGIENNEQENIEFLNKDNQFQVDQTALVVKGLRKRKIMVIGGLILGLPNDDEKSLQKMYDYALDIGIDVPIFFVLTPYPKTKIREELLDENLITNLSDYDKYDTYNVNIKTKHLSSEELFRIKNKMEYKYVLQSGFVWTFIGRYPLFFFKMLFKQLTKHPKIILNFVKSDN